MLVVSGVVSGVVSTLLVAQLVTFSGSAKAANENGRYSACFRDVNQPSAVACVPVRDKKYSLSLPADGAKYLIELQDMKEKKIICTEGPVESGNKTSAKVVNIECGSKAVAWWILLGAVGVATISITQPVSGGGGN